MGEQDGVGQAATSSTRMVTSGAMPRMTNGLRAAQTRLRHKQSSSPATGPKTNVDIHSCEVQTTNRPLPAFPATHSGAPPHAASTVPRPGTAQATVIGPNSFSSSAPACRCVM